MFTNIFILCISIWISGCSPIFDAPASTSTQPNNDAFYHFCQQLFLENIGTDVLSLNFTFKSIPETLKVSETPLWANVSIDEKDFETGRNIARSTLLEMNTLSPCNMKQEIAYDHLNYYLNLEMAAYDYAYFTSNFSPMLGFHAQFPITMAEFHIDELEDVHTYLKLLNTFDTYVHDLMEFEDKKAEAGYGMCHSALLQTIEECKTFTHSDTENILIQIFPEKIQNLDLTDAEKANFINTNKDAVLNHVIPAYRYMIQTLESQLETAPKKGNLSSYAKGKNYYSHLLKSSIGTDRTPEEWITWMDEAIARTYTELALIVRQNPEIYDTLKYEEYMLNEPEDIVEHFKNTLTKEQFPDISDVQYHLDPVPKPLQPLLSPAMYFLPRIDDLSEQQIYLNLHNAQSKNELMPTLAHEGYPGHLYQTTYFYESDPNPVFHIYKCNGYLEGWAAYIEGLSYDYCGFSSDVADFLRLSNLILPLNLYCRLDLGIHYENWSLDDAEQFLNKYMDLDATLLQDLYDAILFNPTNYLIYGIGMNEILELKKDFEIQYDDAFNQKHFHKCLLDLGPVPFPIIQKYMDILYNITKNTP